MIKNIEEKTEEIVTKNEKIEKNFNEKADKINKQRREELKKYEKTYEELESPIASIQDQLKSIAKCKLGVSEC